MALKTTTQGERTPENGTIMPFKVIQGHRLPLPVEPWLNHGNHGIVVGFTAVLGKYNKSDYNTIVVQSWYFGIRKISYSCICYAVCYFIHSVIIFFSFYCILRAVIYNY